MPNTPLPPEKKDWILFDIGQHFLQKVEKKNVNQRILRVTI